MMNLLTFQATQTEMRFLLMLAGEDQPIYRCGSRHTMTRLFEAGMIDINPKTGVVRLTDLGRRFIAIT